MATKKDEQLSAQVVLRSAGGTAPGSTTQVTSENVREYLPSSSAVTEARHALEEAGFEVGNVVGNSFSISATAKTFEKVFKVKLQSDKEKGVTARASRADEESYELPVGKLPEDARRHVAAVTFTPPPDFGPTSYF